MHVRRGATSHIRGVAEAQRSSADWTTKDLRVVSNRNIATISLPRSTAPWPERPRRSTRTPEVPLGGFDAGGVVEIGRQSGKANWRLPRKSLYYKALADIIKRALRGTARAFPWYRLPGFGDLPILWEAWTHRSREREDG